MRIVPVAERLGFTIAIEPELVLFIETAAEYHEFKKTFFPKEAKIRMNCDMGYLFCVGEDPAQILRTMPGEVAHVHLEDIGSNRVHQHRTPGKGAIDFRAIFAALDEIGYAGWVTVELYPYETTAAGVTRQAFEYLTPLLNEA
jgi:sugar phosphate isomerase/epimerase